MASWRGQYCSCSWETREKRFAPGHPQDPETPKGGHLEGLLPFLLPPPNFLTLSTSTAPPSLCSSYSSYSTNTLGTSLPQGLCTGWSCYLESSFFGYPCGLHTLCIQVSSQCPLFREVSLITVSKITLSPAHYSSFSVPHSVFLHST